MRLTYERDDQGYLRERLNPRDVGATGADLDVTPADLLARNHVGRLGFVRYDVPILLPVNYAVDEQGCVVFRTTRGSKLYVAENETVSAAFEVDEFDEETGRGVTAVVRGRMVAVVDEVEIAALRKLGLTPFADAVARERWVRIVPEVVDAWTFGPANEAASV